MELLAGQVKGWHNGGGEEGAVVPFRYVCAQGGSVQQQGLCSWPSRKLWPGPHYPGRHACLQKTAGMAGEGSAHTFSC